MTIIRVSITGKIRCRECSKTTFPGGVGKTFEEAEKALHEDLEDRNWTDGLCPPCAKKHFLNTNRPTDP